MVAVSIQILGPSLRSSVYQSPIVSRDSSLAAAIFFPEYLAFFNLIGVSALNAFIKIQKPSLAVLPVEA